MRKNPDINQSKDSGPCVSIYANMHEAETSNEHALTKCLSLWKLGPEKAHTWRTQEPWVQTQSRSAHPAAHQKSGLALGKLARDVPNCMTETQIKVSNLNIYII